MQLYYKWHHQSEGSLECSSISIFGHLSYRIPFACQVFLSIHFIILKTSTYGERIVY